jgi:hypothetical protein
MDTTSTSAAGTGNAPDNLIQNPLDADRPARDTGGVRPQPGQPHEPGPGLLTNPLDKPGAKDNLIKNPLDKP